ncbi:hypothetical protein EF888_11345 [Silicimonas algicola]|nr:hypothetical protein EF888_11345 [Silicimonas algicola]
MSGQLREATAALASVAGDGQEALAAGMGTVGQACGACHKAHRQAEN